MSAPILVGQAFRSRYALQRFRDGGILVDLATGNYLRLNVSAADICLMLAETEERGSARAELARRSGRAEAESDKMIQDVMDGLDRLGQRREPLGSFRYLPDEEGGYVLSSNNTPRLLVNADGTSVRLASMSHQLDTMQLYGYLRAIAPKLLFLQSTVVIHGAASRVPNGVRVISGESGAGKTTTARAFDAAGSSLFAEDMLVVGSISPLSVHSGGEEAINAWANRSAERFVGRPDGTVDASRLRAATQGEQTPVSEIWFLDRSKRRGDSDEILRTRLGETDGALAMMASLFLGSARTEAWRAFLSFTYKAVADIPLFGARMPTGLDRLQVAIRRYKENSAS